MAGNGEEACRNRFQEHYEKLRFNTLLAADWRHSDQKFPIRWVRQLHHKKKIVDYTVNLSKLLCSRTRKSLWAESVTQKKD